MCEDKSGFSLNISSLWWKTAEEGAIPSALWSTCLICGLYLENLIMSTVPYGALAVRKVRQNEERSNKGYEKSNMASAGSPPSNLAPAQYSSKFMDSIWGLYNRYSVHNLKKNFDQSKGQSEKQIGTVAAAAYPQAPMF